MRTSKLNREEIVEQLRPYVTEVKKIRDLAYPGETYTGYYNDNPIFQVTDKYIHILRWSTGDLFNTKTKSVNEAISLINEVVLFLKEAIQHKRIEKLNEDF